MKRVGQVFRQKLLESVQTQARDNSATFVLNYQKLSAKQLTELRKELRKAKAKVVVSKNAIAKLALKDFDCPGLADRLSGQTAFIYTNNDASAVSKILVKFSGALEGSMLQGGLLDGKELKQTDVQRLSDLPSREVLLSQLLSAIQSPLTRLAGALIAKNRDLLSILKQLSEKNGGN
ncbi:MAG: 50S ribosomal protein L10 [Candidatus Omnitrophica bacterium]|nr:50S ribosomal protein L10 [Candidatus Omnitrophota bacterium]